METILWTCIEAQRLINNVKVNHDLPVEVKIELIQIFKEDSPKNCRFLDAKAD